MSYEVKILYLSKSHYVHIQYVRTGLQIHSEHQPTSILS